MVVGFGENSIDIIYRLPQYPQPGTATAKVRIDSRAVRPGGQVATTLATCAALGVPTRYVGTVGDDEYGVMVREHLRRLGVDVSAVVERRASTRYAVILLEVSRAERVVLWERDAALTISPGDVRRDWLTGATHVHVDATDPAAALTLSRMAREAGLDVTCDIDQVTPETRALLDAVTLPILAEHVPEALTGIADTERALRAMRHTHPGMLVVTLGERGAAMLHDDDYVHVSGVSIDVVDTTGAGDVFRGAFIHALLNRYAPVDMLRFANSAAAVSCSREGAMESAPSLSEVLAVLRQQSSA